MFSIFKKAFHKSHRPRFEKRGIRDDARDFGICIGLLVFYVSIQARDYNLKEIIQAIESLSSIYRFNYCYFKPFNKPDIPATPTGTRIHPARFKNVANVVNFSPNTGII